MFFKKKVLTPFAALLLAVILCGAAVGGTYLVMHQREAYVEDLYRTAVQDSVFADPDEILPLVVIDRDSDMVSWNEAGDKVLMLTFHKYPDSYTAGETVALSWGEVWSFTGEEILLWYRENKNGVDDWSLRLNQLLGLPADSQNTHITAMWVSPEALLRPAYQTDITAQMTNAFDESNPEREAYRAWFDDNILYSYFERAYPWTRLGYTYDWADNGAEYGLSEFLIRKGAEVTVEFTKPLNEFVSWMDQTQ